MKMRPAIPFLKFSLVVAVMLMFLGCSKTPEQLFPVKGTVTIAGTPLKGGTVQFEMMEKGTASGKVYTSSGEIDENGNFALSTFGKLGAPAGEHRVWVSPNVLAMPDKLGVSVERSSPVPKKYMMPTTTDLTFTVDEGENIIAVNVPSE